MILTNRETRSRLISGAAIACPLVLLVAARAILGIAPASSSAAPSANDDPLHEPHHAHTAPPTPAQRRAIDWIAAWSPSGPVRSPFFYPEPPPPDEPVAQPAPHAESAAATPPTPDFIVTTIMGGSGGGMAAINGRVRRIGDEIAPGWRLTAIDGRAKVVTIAGPDGVRIELSPSERN